MLPKRTIGPWTERRTFGLFNLLALLLKGWQTYIVLGRKEILSLIIKMRTLHPTEHGSCAGELPHPNTRVLSKKKTRVSF
jgi:hypothetical protein